MHETFNKVMEEHVRPAFEAKSTDSEVAHGLRTPDAQALFAAHFDVLMVVYKHYACMECDDEAEVSAEKHVLLASASRYKHKQQMQQKQAAARPTMNLAEFQQLVEDSGLAMTEEDRTRIATVLGLTLYCTHTATLYSGVPEA
jgi:hypothetical protein